MPKFNPKTPKQNSAIFGLAAKRGLSHEDLRDMAAEVTNGRTDLLSKISFEDSNEIIHRLGGKPFPTFTGSRRTVNRRRQQAGVDQIVTQAHLSLMEKLWFTKPERTAVGLRDFCQRMLKLDKPRTTKDCNKIIEAVKAMNKRDKIFNAFDKAA